MCWCQNVHRTRGGHYLEQLFVEAYRHHHHVLAILIRVNVLATLIRVNVLVTLGRVKIFVPQPGKNCTPSRGFAAAQSQMGIIRED